MFNFPLHGNRTSKIQIMKDFISLELPNYLIPLLLDNPAFTFVLQVSEETGELNPKDKFYIRKVAEIGGFEIEIRTNIKNQIPRVTLRGSIHKFYTGGVNCTDFDLKSLRTAINDLCALIGCSMSELLIHSIEFGVNIRLPFSCQETIENTLFYIRETPKDCKYHNKGLLYKFELSQYIVKIYNKGLQYFENGYFREYEDNLLRFEIHVNKMQYLHKKGIGIRSLDDLLRPEIHQKLGNLLISTFNDLVMYDYRIDLSQMREKERLFLIESNNPKYWKKLRTGGGEKLFSRRLDKFRKIINEHSELNLQRTISDLISIKWIELSESVLKLPSNDNSERSDNYPHIVGNNQTGDKIYCLVTGIDISHQKGERKFLSELSVNLIQYTNIELYSRLLSEFGPKDQVLKVNYHIAHNIRNSYHNEVHNLKKRILRTIEQTTLFNINEVLTLNDYQKKILLTTNNRFI